ncbi:hypothetical protein D1BOALGB6SA_9952 [Olavius sp. associated proteobacterium Delta 1]|nr:hypothetical protein D1BOALGB6SA_9952 [Olavius sp. associated proteobacterium Delta 1]
MFNAVQRAVSYADTILVDHTDFIAANLAIDLPSSLYYRISHSTRLSSSHAEFLNSSCRAAHGSAELAEVRGCRNKPGTLKLIPVSPAGKSFGLILIDI